MIMLLIQFICSSFWLLCQEGIVFPSFLDVYVGMTDFHTETSVEVTYVTSEQKHRIAKSESLWLPDCDFSVKLRSFSEVRAEGWP